MKTADGVEIVPGLTLHWVHGLGHRIGPDEGIRTGKIEPDGMLYCVGLHIYAYSGAGLYADRLGACRDLARQLRTEAAELLRRADALERGVT